MARYFSTLGQKAVSEVSQAINEILEKAVVLTKEVHEPPVPHSAHSTQQELVLHLNALQRKGHALILISDELALGPEISDFRNSLNYFNSSAIMCAFIPLP